MDQKFKDQLGELYREFREYDSRQANRLDRWRNVEPESALLLSKLVRSRQAKQVLEIGTSNGFSTLWLADAVNATGGFLTTLEIETNRTTMAQRYIEQFGFSDHVSCMTIDAGRFLADANEHYDLIFLDAERSAYMGYWPSLKRLICHNAGSLLLVDNVISHQEEVWDFLSVIESDPDVMVTVIPVGAGLAMVTKS
jgi:predicted O-methyltransferase YrrM